MVKAFNGLGCMALNARKCIPESAEHVSHIFVEIAHFMDHSAHVLSDISPFDSVARIKSERRIII